MSSRGFWHRQKPPCPEPVRLAFASPWALKLHDSAVPAGVLGLDGGKRVVTTELKPSGVGNHKVTLRRPDTNRVQHALLFRGELAGLRDVAVLGGVGPHQQWVKELLELVP